MNSANAGFDIFDEDEDYDKRHNAGIDASDFIVDIREYDVPYHVRVAIDKGIAHSLRPKPPNLLTPTRYPHWEMVHGRSKARRYFFDMHRGAVDSRRSNRHGL
jgi:DNA polymerase elongation subunit (family B)